MQSGFSELYQMGSQFQPYVVRDLKAWTLEPLRPGVTELCAWWLCDPWKGFQPLSTHILIYKVRILSWAMLDHRDGSQPRDIQDSYLTSLQLKEQPHSPWERQLLMLIFFCLLLITTWNYNVFADLLTVFSIRAKLHNVRDLICRGYYWDPHTPPLSQ